MLVKGVLPSSPQLAVSMQMEFGKRERLLASAEIEGLKKYHFKEVHALQDQLLAQRAAVAKLTAQLQDALQVECSHLAMQNINLGVAVCGGCMVSYASPGMAKRQHVRH